MRRRLVQSTLVTIAVAVLLLGLPLAVAGVLLVRDETERDAQQRADALVRAVAARERSGLPVDLAALDPVLGRALRGHDLAATVITPQGSYRIGHRPAGDALAVRSADGASTVVVEVARSDVDGDATSVVLGVAVVSVVAVAAAVGVATAQARRLSAPLERLAADAERLGSGEARMRYLPSGVDEVDRVASALQRSASQLMTALATEREFATDASHQLRTPLAALSMRLEEITVTDDLQAAHDEAAVALSQVERLSDVVGELLGRARRTRSDSVRQVDLGEVLAQQQEEWRPAFDQHDRRMVVSGAEGVTVRATPGALGQTVATLLENSLVHGAGTVRVTVRRTGSSVVVEVSDEGEGVPAELGPRVFEREVSGRSSTGLGLALARDLVEADGGRLELVRTRPPVFALFLSAGADR